MKVARYVSFSKVPYGRRSQGLVWLIHRPYESTQIKLIEGSRVMNRLDSWLRYNTLSISLDRTMRKTKQNEPHSGPLSQSPTITWLKWLGFHQADGSTHGQSHTLYFNYITSAYQCKRHRFDPWSGRISHATEQLSPCAITTKSIL